MKQHRLDRVVAQQLWVFSLDPWLAEFKTPRSKEFSHTVLGVYASMGPLQQILPIEGIGLGRRERPCRELARSLVVDGNDKEPNVSVTEPIIVILIS